MAFTAGGRTSNGNPQAGQKRHRQVDQVDDRWRRVRADEIPEAEPERAERNRAEHQRDAEPEPGRRRHAERGRSSRREWRARSTTAAAKMAHIASLATKNAIGGIGLARLSIIHPCPRSIATPTPNPKSDAPITPNAPYVAMR